MKRVQDERPPRTQEAKDWMDEEIDAQKVRYDGIVEEIEGIQEERNEWIAEFLRIIQDQGYNVTGDVRRKVSDDEMPKRPDTPDADKVIW